MLVQWDELPVALYPDELEQLFSGLNHNGRFNFYFFQNMVHKFRLQQFVLMLKIHATTAQSH